MKRVKMVLYGNPGVGKSVFASKAPSPFFVCTDGNYEWLEEFGADPNAHINITSWADAKDVFDKIMTKDFNKYETIVIDLTEDLFKWCEQEYCIRNKIEHLSDLGYGKAYDSTRNEFFIEICKLIALDKNVIFIMHGITSVIKDRRGVEHTHYNPSSRIPDKVLDMIEGRVRYFLRCYLKDEELEDGTLIKRRFLSLIPKPDEFGICRGIDENKTPHDIPLEWSEFAKAIGLNIETKLPAAQNEPDQDEPEQPRRRRRRENVEIKEEIKEEAVKEETIEETQQSVENEFEVAVDGVGEPQQISIDIPKTVKEEPAKEDVKEESKEEHAKEEAEKPVSENDRIAEIKARLAARFAAIKK